MSKFKVVPTPDHGTRLVPVDPTPKTEDEWLAAACEHDITYGEEEAKRMESPLVFSEITLSDGDRSILIHVWSDGSWNVLSHQPYWGSKPPHRQTAKRWIRNGYHGDISEEPEFVHSTFAAIKTK